VKPEYYNDSDVKDLFFFRFDDGDLLFVNFRDPSGSETYRPKNGIDTKMALETVLEKKRSLNLGLERQRVKERKESETEKDTMGSGLSLLDKPEETAGVVSSQEDGKNYIPAEGYAREKGDNPGEAPVEESNSDSTSIRVDTERNEENNQNGGLIVLNGKESQRDIDEYVGEEETSSPAEKKSKVINDRDSPDNTGEGAGKSPENGNRRVSELLLTNSRTIFSRIVNNQTVNDEHRFWATIDYSRSGHDGLASTNIVGSSIGFNPVNTGGYLLSTLLFLNGASSSLEERDGDGVRGRLGTMTVGIALRGRARPWSSLDVSALLYYGYNANETNLDMRNSGETKQSYNSHDYGLAMSITYGFKVNRVYTLIPILQLSHLNSNIEKHGDQAIRRFGSFVVRYGLENSITISRRSEVVVTLSHSQLMNGDRDGRNLCRDNLELTSMLYGKISNRAGLAMNLGYKIATRGNASKDRGEVSLGLSYYWF
jgi:hypothetical protein